MSKFYDIEFLYESGDLEQVQRIGQYVPVDIYDPKKEYKCDVLIRNSIWCGQPNNIKADKYIEMKHGDYKVLKEQGLLEYHKWDKATDWIACSKFVAKQFEIVTGIKPEVMHNLLDVVEPTNRIWRLVSATRLTADKGWSRMQLMASMMKQAGIKFIWTVLTNTEIVAPMEEFRILTPRYDIKDFLADADFGVLLSDGEGNPYFVNECLQYGTPVIVTESGGCKEIIKDGKNGYVVPFSMDFDIHRLFKKVPIVENYKQDITAEDWCAELGGAEEKDRPVIQSFVDVKILIGYNDNLLGKYLNTGDTVKMHLSRYNALKKNLNERLGKEYVRMVE
jgi:glycosyltransferase involved in cell wall biosynthesis